MCEGFMYMFWFLVGYFGSNLLSKKEAVGGTPELAFALGSGGKFFP